MGWLDDAINTGSKIVTRAANQSSEELRKVTEEAKAAAQQAAKEAQKAASVATTKAATAAQIVQLWDEIQSLEAANQIQATAKITAKSTLKDAGTALGNVNNAAHAGLYDMYKWTEDELNIPFKINKASFSTEIADLQGGIFNLTLDTVIKGQPVSFDISIDFNDIASFTAALTEKIKDEISKNVSMNVPPFNLMQKTVNKANDAINTAVTAVQVPESEVKKSIGLADQAFKNYKNLQLHFGTTVKIYSFQWNSYLSGRGSGDHRSVQLMKNARSYEQFTIINPSNTGSRESINYNDPIALRTNNWRNHISPRGSADQSKVELMNYLGSWEHLTIVNPNDTSSSSAVLFNEIIGIKSKKWNNYLSGRGGNDHAPVQLMRLLQSWEKWIIKR